MSVGCGWVEMEIISEPPGGAECNAGISEAIEWRNDLASDLDSRQMSGRGAEAIEP